MRLNIFGRIYPVKRVKKCETGGVAEVDFKKIEIRVKEDQRGQKFDECVIHEIVHAVLDRVGSGSTSLQPDFEEVICDSVAKVISENFRLVKR